MFSNRVTELLGIDIPIVPGVMPIVRFAQLARFSFRALQPLFDTAPFALCGRDADSANLSLWARDAKGCLAMQADAVLVA